MRAAVYRNFGEPEDVLKFETDYPTPRATDGQVLIKIESTSLNPIDWKTMKGKGFFSSLPMIPCEDVSGSVVEVGPNCARFSLGDKVMAKQLRVNGGGLAEYCVLPERCCVLKPNNVTFSEAASFPLASLTALQALKKAKIEPGQKVLILGSTGGVGCYAVQIAKAFGCRVTATCGPDNMAWVQSLGAENVINYKTTKWTEVLKGQNFDIIFDLVGGNWNGANLVVKSGGYFVTIVGDEPQQENWNKMQVAWTLAKATVRKVLSITGGPHYFFIITKDNLDDLMRIADLVNKGLLKPCIDREFSFLEAAQAFKYSEQKHAKGKVVVGIGMSQSS